MRTLPSSRRPVKPVQVTAGWLTAEPALALACGSVAGLLIRRDDEPADSAGTGYLVRAYLENGRVSGYRLEKLDGADGYDVDAGFTSCTCPDHVYRARACKHLLGLCSALQQINLL